MEQVLEKTNWDEYYNRPSKIASVTRKISEKKIIGLIKKYFPGNSPIRIAELGGANSCFYEAIREQLKPTAYFVFDNNAVGLELFLKKYANDPIAHAKNADVLNMQPDHQFDLVFSVGLIEHFNEADTRKAIEAHIHILKNGGICLITFPTPTFLYRAARFFAERIGIWIFHDERPLKMKEVRDVLSGYGTILYEGINWPVILTQGYIIIRKHN